MFYFNTTRSQLSAGCLAALFIALIAMPAQATEYNTPPDPACVYKDTDLTIFGGEPYKAPPVIESVNGKLETKLNVVFTNPKKTQIAGCGVTLRSYNGKLVGPTLRVKPGDTIYISLDNKLGAATPDASVLDVCKNPHNVYGGSPLPENFNCTNLHTHGLHVSPIGQADNVLVMVPPIPNPNSDLEAEYSISANPRQIVIKIPENHPSGTFWYHPHVHGATGVQVASGMEGAIIVEDVPAKTPESIKKANINEKIFMLQTIPYDDEGKINDFLALGDDRAYVRNRYLMVNGQIAPTIKMHPGEVQRWRFVDSSFNRSVQLALEQHNLHEIAVDGNYLSQVDTWVNNWENKDYCCTGKLNQERTFKLKRQMVELMPGSRSDVLVQASLKPGRYKLEANTYLTGRLDPSTASFSRETVAFVEVDGNQVADTGIPSNAEMAKLYAGSFTDIKNNNVKYNQIAAFNTDQPKGGNDGGIACDPDKNATPCFPIGFQVNNQVFDPSKIRDLELSPKSTPSNGDGPQTGTDSWTVSSADPTRNHVFHIHTNAFQTTRSDPLGHTETLWRDTLLVKYGQPQTVLTRYEDFDGVTVMHCHLLSHEDMGMMQVIEFKKSGSPTGAMGAMSMKSKEHMH